MSDFSQRQLEQVRIRDAENRNSSCISRPRPMPPMKIIDLIADEKATGGYDVSEKNVCPTCHEVRSLDGSCTGCLLGPGNGPREPDAPRRTPSSRIGRRARQNGLT